MKPKAKHDSADNVRTEIRVWMQRRQVTASELAVRLGHAPSWVSKRIGIGASVPLSVDDVIAIAEALDVAPGMFFQVVSPQSFAASRSATELMQYRYPGSHKGNRAKTLKPAA